MDELDYKLSKIVKSEVDVPKRIENAIDEAINNPNLQKKHTNSILKVAATFVIVCVCGIGVVSAGTATYHFFSKASRQRVDVSPGSDSEIDKEYGIRKDEENDGVYYAKISTYADYQKFKQMWPDIYNMEESDFKDYFMVVVSNYDTSKLPFYISEVTADESTLYISLEQEDTTKLDRQMNFYSTKIEKKYDRENIKITKNYVQPHTDTNRYTDVKKIAEGQSYSIEQAIEEECFVVNFYGEIISGDEKQLSNFIQSTSNGKEGFIRVVTCSNNNDVGTIYDIEYRQNKYYIKTCGRCNTWNSEDKARKITYNTYDKLQEHYGTSDKVHYEHVVDAIDNGSGIAYPIVEWN